MEDGLCQLMRFFRYEDGAGASERVPGNRFDESWGGWCFERPRVVVRNGFAEDFGPDSGMSEADEEIPDKMNEYKEDENGRD